MISEIMSFDVVTLSEVLLYSKYAFSFLFFNCHISGAERTLNNRLLAWKLLLSVQEMNSDWPGVEVTCSAALKFMAENSTATIPGDEDSETYRARLRLSKAKALVQMGHINHLRQAVAVLESVRMMLND